MNIYNRAAVSIAESLVKAVVNGSSKIRLIVYLSIFFIVVGMLLAGLSEAEVIPKYYSILAAVSGFFAAIGILGISSYQYILDEQQENIAIQQVEDRAKENPNEPTAAWDLARLKLEKYLNRNLSQINWIFGLTSFVMIAGFIIIGYGIMKSYQPDSKLSSTIITTLSGVIIEFIGATFLVIYKSTMLQAQDYVNVLERINAVGMSVQIFESISDEDIKLRDQTKAEISKQLLELYSPNKK